MGRTSEATKAAAESKTKKKAAAAKKAASMENVRNAKREKSVREQELERRNQELETRIQELEEENRRLKKRLTRITTNKKRKRAVKPIHMLSKSARSERVQRVTQLFKGNEESISPTRAEPFLLQLEKQLNVHTPKKPSASRYIPRTTRSLKSALMDPLDDLRIFSRLMTWKQRVALKRRLIAIKKDILAPSTQVYAKLNELKSAVKVETSVIDDSGRCMAVVTNIRQVLEDRLSRLSKQSRVHFDGQYANKICLCLVGDKGGQTTKCAISCANVRPANSPDNLLFAAVYEGSDSRTELTPSRS
jgi:hypothetical protein